SPPGTPRYGTGCAVAKPLTSVNSTAATSLSANSWDRHMAATPPLERVRHAESQVAVVAPGAVARTGAAVEDRASERRGHAVGQRVAERWLHQAATVGVVVEPRGLDGQARVGFDAQSQ